MIPVNENNLIKFDINSENEKYRQILISQYHFCNKHITEIQSRALETYTKSQKNKFLKKVCCNFKLLEEKLRECYNSQTNK